MINPLTFRAAGLLLIGAPLASPAFGNTTYLIDPDKGNDSNPAGRPWKTFGRLNAQMLAPGDTVIIAPGRQRETLKPSPFAGNRSLATEKYLVRSMAENSLLSKVSRCEPGWLPFVAYLQNPQLP